MRDTYGFWGDIYWEYGWIKVWKVWKRKKGEEKKIELQNVPAEKNENQSETGEGPRDVVDDADGGDDAYNS